MKFLDQAKIYLKSGDGGAGCLSFRREKYIEFGGPNGGNGGRGGDIIVKAVDNLNTLIDYRYQQHFKAARGGYGKGQHRSGAAGETLYLKMPVGTQIFDETKQILLADLTETGQEIRLLKGGDGGFGNAHYKSATNQAPRRADKGWPGQEMWIWIQLKLIADVGLVGLPNAGKSTFLAAVSAARPKIADYPFTTLVPQLGVVRVNQTEFVLADIPGLIEQAHEGAGLGTRFLGHVERCKALVHLIDGTQENIVQSYHTIQKELQLYGHDLDQKIQFLVLNKCDALSLEEQNTKLKVLAAASGQDVYSLSAVTKAGMDTLLYKILEHIHTEEPADPPLEFHPLNT